MRYIIFLAFAFAVSQSFAEDTVEFLSGAKLTGTVIEIRKADQEFDFEAVLGTRKTVRTYPFSKIHAVTMKGKRYTLNAKAAGDDGDSSSQTRRSRDEINALINSVGASMPDWFDQTKLDYPPSLDLSWPLKPGNGWNNQKNMGQYIWDVIHPNPGRWHSGIKLVHHCMTLHKDDSVLLGRDIKTVGRMYFQLLQDYPRAAYWIRKAGVAKGDPASVDLAECYWRMGNRDMAIEQLKTNRYTGGGAVKSIKLYGNMGDLQQALSLTQLFEKSAGQPHQGWIMAGDALRQAGRFDEAVTYYEKVLSDKTFRNKEYENRFKARARESIDAIRLYEQVDVGSLADGSYRSFSTGYNGRLDVEVTIAAGKITAVKVTNHREKQFYSALSDTEQKIIDRQSVGGVDGTSGATITSLAIINASAKALAGNSQ